MVILTVTSIALNELVFLYLFRDDLVSALTWGWISGVAGAALYYLLNAPKRSTVHRRVPEPETFHRWRPRPQATTTLVRPK
ncbi:MAG: hypothetical protein ABI759_12410 [Candidatus Solibacter sp.]